MLRNMKNWWRIIIEGIRGKRFISGERKANSTILPTKMSLEKTETITLENKNKGVSMSFKSILSGVGHFAEAVLNWLGSPVGQGTVNLIESGIETFVPATAGAINLFDIFAKEAVKIEVIGTAAASQPGQSSTQKAAAVLANVGPEVINFAEQYGLQQPTADELKKMNDLAVEWLNLFKPKVINAPAGSVKPAANPMPTQPMDPVSVTAQVPSGITSQVHVP